VDRFGTWLWRLGHRVALVVLWFVFVVVLVSHGRALPGSALEVTLDDLALVGVIDDGAAVGWQGRTIPVCVC
jgi:hypothetical protein